MYNPEQPDAGDPIIEEVARLYGLRIELWDNVQASTAYMLSDVPDGDIQTAISSYEARRQLVTDSLTLLRPKLPEPEAGQIVGALDESFEAKRRLLNMQGIALYEIAENEETSPEVRQQLRIPFEEVVEKDSEVHNIFQQILAKQTESIDRTGEAASRCFKLSLIGSVATIIGGNVSLWYIAEHSDKVSDGKALVASIALNIGMFKGWTRFVDRKKQSYSAKLNDISGTTKQLEDVIYGSYGVLYSQACNDKKKS